MPLKELLMETLGAAEHTEHPFARVDLTDAGEQWSGEVDTVTPNTDVEVERVTIDPPASGRIIEGEFGLTAAFRAPFNGYVAWEADTAYELGDIVVPTTPNDRIYECTTAGISAGVEPVWPDGEGDTIADNTVEWTCRFIKNTYKWQARNRGGSWVDLHPAATISPSTSAYQQRTRSGRIKTVANLNAVPLDIRLLFQCNYANQGRAKAKNSSLVRIVYKAE